MIGLCVRLLERMLPAEWSDHVIGDLLEQRARGDLWFLRQTLAAVLLLRGAPHGGDSTVSTFLNDMRIGVRHLRRAPAFAITSILTLGISIGATTAIFSVIEPVLLQPLPYPSPERLVFVWERNRDGTRDNVGFQTFRDLADQASSLERAAAVGGWEPTLGDDQPERLVGSRVSWTYFRTLGVQPAIGRDFLSEEDQPDHNRVVILSHNLWSRRFNGDSSVVGRAISIGGTPMTVIGVLPASFDNVVSPTAEIFRVLGYAPSLPFACRTCHHLRMIARVKAGVSMQAATTELDRLFARLTEQYPTEYASVGAMTVRMQDEATRAFRPALLALSGAVLLVLLIAVANVVNLQLTRGVRRHDEFAIRAALGAGRGRLTQQLLAEGLVLALAGGAAALIVAWIALPTLVRQLPMDLPRLAAIHLDTPALLAVGAIVLALALVMALVPGSRGDSELGSSLRSGRRLASGAQHLTRSTLVVVEVALAAMLLASAALVAKSLVRLLGVDAGFDTTHLLSLQVDAVGPRYRDEANVYGHHDRIRQVVAAIPGVTSVALANQLPLGGNMDRYGVLDADNVPANPELVPSGDRYVVTPEYLATMRIPMRAGRWFTAAEAADNSNKVALVSEALAKRLWPGQSALGKRVQMGGTKAPMRRVIGVTGNVKHSGLDAETTMQFYVPERQWFFADNAVVIVVRTALDPASLAQSIRRAVATIDPTLPIIRVATMDQLIATSTAQRRLALVLFGAFAIAALLLAVAGIYGVLAGSVAERTREIGLRSALGATPREIVALVLRQGTRLAAIGLVIGFAGGAALTRYLQTFLFEIGANDPATLAVVIGVLAAVTLAACAIPAVRALRIDPSEALRSD